MVKRTVQDFLRDLWAWKYESETNHSIPNVRPKPLTLEELRESEWSEEFEKFMRNRLIMGAIRYGRLSDNRNTFTDNGGTYDRPCGGCGKWGGPGARH